MTWKDKVAHFCVTAAIFFAVVWLTGNGSAALICSLVFAFGKEYYDQSRGGKWDWLDILADLLGLIFAYAVWRA